MRVDATVALYESLARFQWWRRRWSHAATGEGLEMRKRLLPPADEGPRDGGAGLDAWLMARLGERRRNRVIDLGCGFGASMLRWLAAGSEQAIGVTPSSIQLRRGRQLAKTNRLADRCQWLCQPLESPLPGPCDVVLAIESLGHTRDLQSVLRNVRRALADKGVLLWVEDLLVSPPGAEDPDVAELAAAWSSPPLRDVAAAHGAMLAAGLAVVEEIDLTAQVPARSLESIDKAHRRLSRWHRLLPLPFARRVSRAFIGGFALERLYLRGAACYRFMMAQSVAESS